MRIQHDCLINGILSEGHSSLYSHQLHIDVGTIEGSALLRKVTYITRLHTVTVDQTGNFHTCVAGQIGDQAIVQHITADSCRLVRFHCLHNIACIFF